MQRIHCFIIIFILVTSLPVPLKGQVGLTYTRAQLDSIMNPKQLEGGESIMEFRSKSYNLGEVTDQDSTLRCPFVFKNISNREITITGIKTTCGCTFSKYPTTGISPGEEGSITLLYTPEKREGKIDIKAYIYTSESATSPTIILTLDGVVKSNDKWDYLPYSIGDLRIKRKRVSFEAVKSGTKPQMHIICANSGNEPLKLTAIGMPQYAEFKTIPATIMPDSEGEIVITIDGTKLQKFDTVNEFRFQIEGVDAQVIEKTIKVTIENQINRF